MYQKPSDISSGAFQKINLTSPFCLLNFDSKKGVKNQITNVIGFLML